MLFHGGKKKRMRRNKLSKKQKNVFAFAKGFSLLSGEVGAK
jgi:hypothetical protein